MKTPLINAIKKIRCKRCQHSWEYKGRNDYQVTCPHCGTKIGIRKLLHKLDQSKSIPSSRIAHSGKSPSNGTTILTSTRSAEEGDLGHE